MAEALDRQIWAMGVVLMDRVAEVADLIRRLGLDAARVQMEAEIAADTTPLADITTTEDEIMRRYGDLPDVEIE
ncbi:hypothetical protein [Streptomyces uncialis]|uniref:hypothetical protein n=1 Tax=Streptomyces uncialis TaxID=1048205 RepID=UPI0037A0BD0F